MRRAVEKENRDIDKKIGGGDRKSKGKRRRKQRVNACLFLLVLSPLLVIGAVIYTLKLYKVFSRAEDGIKITSPGKMDATKKQMGSPDAKPKRLRISRTEEEDAAKKLSKAEIREKLKGKSSKKQKDADEFRDRFGKKYLVLTTKHGNIKITLRPDLSQGSVDYIYKLVDSYGGNGNRCMHCNFYRSEKPGILQGIMAHEDVVPVNKVLGSCPEGLEGVKNDCPEWDKQCGCHGPVMTRGSVAWCAGEAGGPDFFIDGYPDPAKWWGTQHTNFGFIDDEASMKVVDAIFELPIESTKDMDFLKDPIHFDLVLE